MSFWTIVKNIGTIIDFFKLAGRVVGEGIKQKKFPDCEDSVLLIDKTAELLKRGIIDVPGVDEKQIAASLDEIKARIVCKPSQ